MRDNEYVQHPSRPLAPAWAALNSQHLIVLASMIPKDQKNITTLKWSTGQLFTAATQHLTPAVVKYNKSHRRAGATLDFLLSLLANKEMFEQNINVSFFIKLIILFCHISFVYIFYIYKYTYLYIYIYINRDTQFEVTWWCHVVESRGSHVV
jgi:hypothetical protein